MKRALFRTCFATAVAAILAVASTGLWPATPAVAFEAWNLGCNNCHGDFRAAPYYSQHDGVQWLNGTTATNLHDGHRTTMLSSDCNVCHTGSSRTPVYIGSSNGGTGFSKIGCSGCHLGEGLRAKHIADAGYNCTNCHATPSPSPENTLPPYYFTPDAAHPNKPTDPCNANATESRLSPALGLDNDGNGLYDSADPACRTNRAPTASPDSATTAFQTPVTITVLTNDSDPDGNPLTVTAVGTPTNGAAVRNANNTITYTPGTGFTGSASFTYTISDGQGGTAQATVTVTVQAPVNQAPTAVSDSATTPEDTSVTVAVLTNDSDPNGDTLTVSAVGAPANGTAVKNSNNTITYTPNANFSGANSFSYTISDGHGGTASATVSVTVSPINDSPVANNDSSTTPEDTPVTVTVLTNDSDVDGDTLTVTTVGVPANGAAVRNSNNTITYTPNANFNGTNSFSYTISDGHGGTASATVTATVSPINDAPVANNDSATTPEDTPITVAVLVNDTDSDGDPLTVTAAANGAHGTVAKNSNNTVTYTPNANYNGSDTFAYTVSDGFGGTAQATATITITAVNDAPVAANDAASTSFQTPVGIPALANDTDVDGPALRVAFFDAATANGGTVSCDTVNPGGLCTYTPTAGFSGTDTFTYNTSDGFLASNSATVSITVSGRVNLAPVAVDDSATTPEDTPVTIPVLANDSDPNTDALTVTAAGAASNGTASINSGATITYTPKANFNGSDQLTYTISDPSGLTATATVRVTVSPVDDTPVAADDAVTTVIDTPVVVPVLANDSDVDGDALSVSAVGAATNGVVAANLDNTITYTPNAGFSGTDSFSYSVSDPSGATDTGTVSVVVQQAPNRPPMAVNDAATTEEDTAIVIDPLANDSDPDGDSLTLMAAGSPSHGTAAVNADNTVTYTPNANFNGTDQFTYTVSDPDGLTSTAAVTVSVTPVNDAPAAKDDAATTQASVSINVLANDTDVDGDLLAVTGGAAPAHGTAVVNANNTVTYSPSVGFTGSDSFTYTVSDPAGLTSTATVTVTVQPVITNTNLVDLDIVGFKVPDDIELASKDLRTIRVELRVANRGKLNRTKPATVVGTQRTGQGTILVYKWAGKVYDAPGGDPKTFTLPSCSPTRGLCVGGKARVTGGTIDWIATISDDDPDSDIAAASTRVKPVERESTTSRQHQ